ncbi:MAG: very short patch repair endonuclease [Bacteroidota bacterium]
MILNKQGPKVPEFNPRSGFTTTPERSRLMRKIKSKETKAEKTLRLCIWNNGLRYRKNLKTLPGKPDIAITPLKIAIFVDGGFWHGKEWEKEKRKLKSNRDFWIPKIERNIERDIEVKIKLESMGWTVLRFWEDQVLKNTAECMNEINDLIKFKIIIK